METTTEIIATDYAATAGALTATPQGKLAHFREQMASHGGVQVIGAQERDAEGHGFHERPFAELAEDTAQVNVMVIAGPRVHQESGFVSLDEALAFIKGKD